MENLKHYNCQNKRSATFLTSEKVPIITQGLPNILRAVIIQVCLAAGRNKKYTMLLICQNNGLDYNRLINCLGNHRIYFELPIQQYKPFSQYVTRSCQDYCTILWEFSQENGAVIYNEYEYLHFVRLNIK